MPMHTLTHERLELFLRCRRKFRQTVARRTGFISIQTQVAKTVGQAVEFATATDVPEERLAIIAAALQTLPEAEQPEALSRIEECISNSDVLRAAELSFDDEDADEVSADSRHRYVIEGCQSQVQFSWDDPVTGWTLKAKPDWVQQTCDSRGPVLRIIDDKTAGHCTTYHKRNLYFFGLVVAKQLDFEQFQARQRGERYVRPTIELVVRLLGERDNPQEPREIVLGFYSRKREWAQLDEIRRVIAGIEEAFATDDFPAKTDWNCDTCPHRLDCPAFLALGETVDEALPSTA